MFRPGSLTPVLRLLAALLLAVHTAGAAQMRPSHQDGGQMVAALTGPAGAVARATAKIPLDHRGGDHGAGGAAPAGLPPSAASIPIPTLRARRLGFGADTRGVAASASRPPPARAPPA